MKLVFLEPQPALVASGVLTPLGEGAAAIDDARQRAANAAALPDSVPVDLAALTGETPLRFRRMDRYATLGFAAAYLALGGVPRERHSAVDAEHGIYVGSSLACWGSNAEFFEALRRHPAGEASPALFARTVPNAVNGEISIAHRIGGSNETFVSGWTAGADALGEAAQQVAAGRARAILAGGVEAPSEALRRLHGAARREHGNGWLPEQLAEAAALCLLAGPGEARPDAPRLCAFGRAFDPQGSLSLTEILSALRPLAVSRVLFANHLPAQLGRRWRRESAGAEVIDLTQLTGELGAAGAPVALALACRPAPAPRGGASAALVVARGIAGETAALALALSAPRYHLPHG